MPNQPKKILKPGSENSTATDGISRKASRTYFAAKKIKNALFILSGVLVSLIIAPLVIIYAFTGPSGSAGSGYGAIQFNQTYNRLGFSTSTIIIGTSTLDTSLIPNPPTTPSTDPKLFVNGQLVANSITAYEVSSTVINGGNFTGKIPADNISPGVFNSPNGGNYSFPGYIGVNTSTYGGLPQALSVYGGGYFSGNVGIGTSNPSAPLDIISLPGSSNVVALSVDNQNVSPPSLAIGIMSKAANNGNNTDYDFYGQGPRTLFSGNVGIGYAFGSNTGGYALNVSGTSMFGNILEAKTATTTQIRWRRSTGSTFADLISPVGGGRVGISAKNVAPGAVGGLSFYVSPSTEDTLAMTIIDTGNVGINTSNPTYKLDVNGTFHATGQIQTGVTGIKYSDGSVQTSAFMGGTTGSTGRVVFWQTTTTLGFDSNFFWDNVNKRLGIRTSVPNRPLTIVGENTNNELIGLAKADGTQKWYINTKDYIGTFNGLNFGETGGSDYALFLESGGNVGIGTGNPASKLGISGNVTIGLSSGFSDPGNPHAAPAGGLIVEGLVGIGTYAPSYSLHVAGNSMVTGSSSVAGTTFLNGDVNLGDTGGWGGDNIYFKGKITSDINFAGPLSSIGNAPTKWILGGPGGTGGNGGGITIMAGGADMYKTGGDLTLSGGYGSGSGSGGNAGNIYINTLSAAGSGGGDIIFQTSPTIFSSSLTERMRISRFGNIFTGAGYVGIGTASPIAKLSVAGGAVIGSTYASSYDAPSSGLLVEGNVVIGDNSTVAKLQVTSAGSSAIRIKKTAGVAGSVDLFVVKGDTATNTGTFLCQTVAPTNSICLGYWSSSGVVASCTGTGLTNGRALCADFGD